jgi:hypothetical protein
VPATCHDLAQSSMRRGFVVPQPQETVTRASWNRFCKPTDPTSGGMADVTHWRLAEHTEVRNPRHPR